jgi:hypothetical protein
MQRTLPRASLAVAVLAAALLLSGCDSCKAKQPDAPAAKPQTPPAASVTPGAPLKTPEEVRQEVERVVKGYLNAPACNDRLQFILNPQKNGALFLDYYSAVGCTVHFRSMDASDCATPKNGACWVKVQMGVPTGFEVSEEEHSYCIALAPTPKIDWRCSKGYNTVPLAQFKAAHDDARPAKLRLYAEPGDQYLDEYADAKSTTLSIRLRDADGATINGFIEKDSRLGQVLADLLKDKKAHQVVLELGYSRRNDNRDAASILTLFEIGWREYPAELE